MSCATCGDTGVEFDGSPCGACPPVTEPATETDGVDQPARPRTYWTATDLLAADLPPIRWAVDGLVPEGATLLVGAPKLGKSWAALGLALAVAAGGRALGAVPVDGGDVLVLALEDGPRRLRDRLAKLLAGDLPPSRLAFLTDAPPIDAGLTDLLDRWAESVTAPRLVVVDVLAKVRPSTSSSLPQYERDYATVAPLQRWATGRGIAVLIVHHTRKQGDDDPLATVSGTFGVTGAADAVLVLTRSRTAADAVLAVTGRDVPESELALTFDAQLGTWRLLGPAAEYALSAERRAILEAVRDAGSARPKQIAAESGVDYEVVRKLVVRMADAGQLDTDGHGTYLPPAGTDNTVPSVPFVPDRGVYTVPTVPSQGTQGTQGRGYPDPTHPRSPRDPGTTLGNLGDLGHLEDGGAA